MPQCEVSRRVKHGTLDLEPSTDSAPADAVRADAAASRAVLDNAVPADAAPVEGAVPPNSDAAEACVGAGVGRLEVQLGESRWHNSPSWV